MTIALFDCDCLGKVARLVDVAPASAGDVVCEQLQRDYAEYNLQLRIGVRDVDDLLGVFRDFLASLTRDHEHPGPASSDLGEVRKQLGEDTPIVNGIKEPSGVHALIGRSA